jgi:hypothetical protein
MWLARPSSWIVTSLIVTGALPECAFEVRASWVIRGSPALPSRPLNVREVDTVIGRQKESCQSTTLIRTEGDDFVRG